MLFLPCTVPHLITTVKYQDIKLYIQPSIHTLLLNLVVLFLDTSKAFDKVWHEGLIFKLTSVGISEALLELIKSFLTNRFQRVVVNDQRSEWLPVKAGVPQRSILGPLFFLMYINNLSFDIISRVKLFAYDTSLFYIVHDPNTLANELNEDLQKISEWAYQWKMSFNPDQNKQPQEVIFSRKITKSYFNNMPIFSVNFQKHLGIYLDGKLNFSNDIKEKIYKAMQGVGVIRKLSKILP